MVRPPLSQSSGLDVNSLSNSPHLDSATLVSLSACSGVSWEKESLSNTPEDAFKGLVKRVIRQHIVPKVFPASNASAVALMLESIAALFSGTYDAQPPQSMFYI